MVHQNISTVFLFLMETLFYQNCVRIRVKALFVELIFGSIHQTLGLHFIKKESLGQVFSCEFWEISRNTFFTEHIWKTASQFCNKCLTQGLTNHRLTIIYLLIYSFIIFFLLAATRY